jgi:hypothetical protein
MNNERYNQIIDEVYEKYLVNFTPQECPPHLDVQPEYYRPMTKEQFVKIIKLKGSSRFTKDWGLLIEERELEAVERMEYYGKHYMKENETKSYDELLKVDYDGLNIPKREVYIKYNNETIEVYE